MCFKFVFDFDENYIFIINRTVYVFLLASNPHNSSSTSYDNAIRLDESILNFISFEVILTF